MPVEEEVCELVEETAVAGLGVGEPAEEGEGEEHSALVLEAQPLEHRQQAVVAVVALVVAALRQQPQLVPQHWLEHGQVRGGRVRMPRQLLQVPRVGDALHGEVEQQAGLPVARLQLVHHRPQRLLRDQVLQPLRRAVLVKREDQVRLPRVEGPHHRLRQLLLDRLLQRRSAHQTAAAVPLGHQMAHRCPSSEVAAQQIDHLGRCSSFRNKSKLRIKRKEKEEKKKRRKCRKKKRTEQSNREHSFP